MEYRKDFIGFQIINQRSPLLQALCLDIEHMPVVHAPFRHHRQFNLPAFSQGTQIFIIPVPGRQPGVVDFLRNLQLCIEIGGVHVAGQVGRAIVDPGVLVDLSPIILAAVGALLPDDFRFLHILFVPDQKRPALSHAVVLRLMEAEAPEVPYGPQGPALIGGHDSLGRVLNHRQPMPVRDLHDRVHLAGHAGIVDGHDGPGPLRHRSLYELFVQIHGIRPDVHEHRDGSPQHESVRGGHEGEGRHDDLIPGLNPGEQQRRQLRGMGAGSGQQAFRRAGLLLDPFVAFLRIAPVAADFLVRDAFLDILHGFRGIWGYIKSNHSILSYNEYPLIVNPSLPEFTDPLGPGIWLAALKPL